MDLQLEILHASNESELDAAFIKVLSLGVGGLVISGDPFFHSKREYIATLSLRYRIPVIFQLRGFAAAGGLMSYDDSYSENIRLVGVYVGRILKGEKPSNLPVQQTTKIELIINMKTVMALGLTFPLSLLGMDDAASLASHTFTGTRSTFAMSL